eukprot:6196043-Pleurochrysis_carterae.AAC.2
MKPVATKSARKQRRARAFATKSARARNQERHDGFGRYEVRPPAEPRAPRIERIASSCNEER